MSIQLAIPESAPGALKVFLLGILRKAADATGLPLFVDEVNQRVIIGARTAASANNGTLEVNGDIRLQTSSQGILFVDAQSRVWRMLVRSDAEGNPTVTLTQL